MCLNIHEDIVYESGFDVCRSCGEVIEMVLDDSVPYNFDNGIDDGYHGVPNSFLGSHIEISKLHTRLQESLKTPQEVSSREYGKDIDDVCRLLNIPPDHVVCHTAKEISQKRREKHNCHRRKATAASCVYLSCKIHKAARELRLISSKCSIDMKSLSRELKTVMEIVKYETSFDVTSSYHAIAIQFIQNLGYSDLRNIKRHVLNMLEMYDSLFDHGKKPRSLVAAIVFAVSNKFEPSIDIHQVSSASGVCGQTIIKTLAFIKKVAPDFEIIDL